MKCNMLQKRPPWAGRFSFIPALVSLPLDYSFIHIAFPAAFHFYRPTLKTFAFVVSCRLAQCQFNFKKLLFSFHSG